MEATRDPVLRVEGLTKHFPIGRVNIFRGQQQVVHAVETVSFTIERELGMMLTVQQEIEGVTQSADWGWDDPEDFSAPV